MAKCNNICKNNGNKNLKLNKNILTIVKSCGMIILAVHGEMSERFKEPVLKTGDSFCEPWVRIPLSPPPFFVSGGLKE